MKKNIWCRFLFLHIYEIIKEEPLTNNRGDVIGTVIIQKCANCGKLKITKVYTEDGHATRTC